jgi:hypothetical protein
MSQRRRRQQTAQLIQAVKSLQARQAEARKRRKQGVKSLKPSHPGKPHGSNFSIRRRCVFCGYIVNNSERFTWLHKHQTFRVEMGGRIPGGKGIIKYTEIKDPEYDKMMIEQLRRVAENYGFSLKRLKETQ